MNLQTSDFAGLNDDECKRILSVIERDFHLRQKEAERLQFLNKAIREENERVQFLLISPDFNSERCIRCFKPFKIFFNPKEKCLTCQLFVCRRCFDENRRICHSCQHVKNLKTLTSNWFYDRSSEKHKRCGSSKVVRELHKREKEIAELDDDLGYSTLPTDSNRFVVHDKTLRLELNEFSKRIKLIIDNRKELKHFQTSIQNELTRARTALSHPMRQMKTTKTNHCEFDLQNLIVQQLGDFLSINFEEFQKNLIEKPIESTEFDEKLAEIIAKHLETPKTRRTRLEIIRFSRISSSSTSSDEIISSWL